MCLFIACGGKVDSPGCFVRDGTGAVYLEPTGMRIAFQRYGRAGVAEVTRSASGDPLYTVQVLDADGSVLHHQQVREIVASTWILMGMSYITNANMFREPVVQNALRSAVRARVVVPRCVQLDYAFIDLFYEYVDGGRTGVATENRLACPLFSREGGWCSLIGTFVFDLEHADSSLLVNESFIKAMNSVTHYSNLVACLNRGMACFLFDDFGAADVWFEIAAAKAESSGNRMMRYRAVLWLARSMNACGVGKPSLLLSEIVTDRGSWRIDADLVAQVEVWHAWCVWCETGDADTLRSAAETFGGDGVSPWIACDARCRLIVASLKAGIKGAETQPCLDLLVDIKNDATLWCSRLYRCIGAVMLLEGDRSFDEVDAAFRMIAKSIEIDRMVRPRLDRAAAAVAMVAELAAVSGVFWHIVSDLRDAARGMFSCCDQGDVIPALDLEAMLV